MMAYTVSIRFYSVQPEGYAGDDHVMAGRSFLSRRIARRLVRTQNTFRFCSSRLEN
jgi:hypothetical protein